MRVRVLLLVGVMAVLAGCQAKLDASSQEALVKSIGKMVESVPEAERPALRADIQQVSGMAGASFVVSALVQKDVGATMFNESAKHLDGMTLEQVRTKAREQRLAELKKRNELDISAWEKEVNHWQERLDAEIAAQGALSKVVVTSFEPQLAKFGTSGEAAVVEVQNGWLYPISHLAFEVEADIADGTQPARRSAFSPEIRVSMAPGETRRLSLSSSAMLGREGVTIQIVSAKVKGFKSAGGVPATGDSAVVEQVKAALQRAQDRLAQIRKRIQEQDLSKV